MIRDNEILEALLDSVRRFVRERLVPAAKSPTPTKCPQLSCRRCASWACSA